MLDDEVFWKVVGNNHSGTPWERYPSSIALALLMAVWVNGRLPARGLVRMAYFTPTVLPMIAVANIWLFFYTPDIGLLDQVLGAFGQPGHNWLGDPETVLGCIIVMTVWKEAGFFMIFYLGCPPVPAARAGGSGQAGRRRAWAFLSAGDLPALDANHAVCPDQCGDQLLQAGRPTLHPDQGRAG